MEYRSRGPYYTDKERMFLAQLIFEEKVIESKKTRTKDQRKSKNEAWERVTKRFCSQGFTPRTSKQLKKCWVNMKQRKRKFNTLMKVQHLMMDGSVSPAVFDDLVMDAPNLDLEISCPFDSTAQFKKEYDVKNNSKRQLITNDEEDMDRTMKREQTSVLKNKDFYNLTDEKELRLKLRDAIKQQRELYSKKMKVIDAKMKVALLELSMAKVKEQSEM